MNYGRELPWFLAVALCAAVALYVGAFALGSGSLTGQHLAIALIALGVGLVILFIAVTYRNAALQRDLVRLARETQNVIHETRQERRVAADMAARVSVLSQEHTHQSANWTVILNEIRQNQATLAAELRELALQRHQRVETVQAYSDAVPATPNETVEEIVASQALASETIPVFSEDLAVSLEPVIDLFSSKAAHYRLSYAMRTADGLDLQIMREAFALLMRLRRNDQRLSILTPIGALTLAQPEAVSRIVQLFQSEPDLQDGLVIDVPHAVLAGLSSGSLEGLAYLARAGIGLSLSQVALGGLDLATLQQLNVRFVSIAATGIGAEPQQSAGIASFVQAARAMKVQVIVEGVATRTQATQIMRVARFASGPAFAEPRRVRRNGSTQSAMSVAAE